MSDLGVTLLRLILPLVILDFPLAGGILSIIADYFDWNIISSLQLTPNIGYQRIDKTLDMYYLTVELLVALRWTNQLAKYTAVFLFYIRLIGFVFFELTGLSILLVVFPNLFEFFFLFYLAFLRIFGRDPVTSIRKLLLILGILLLPKLILEYFLHVNTTDPWSSNQYVVWLTSKLFGE